MSLMKILRIIILIFIAVPKPGFSQDTALEKLQNLESSNPDIITQADTLIETVRDSGIIHQADTVIETSRDLDSPYLADTVLIAGMDTSYFLSGDPESNLLRATEFGQFEVVRMLVERGVHVDASTYEGVTSLMYASQNGDIQIMKYLIGKGANVNDTPWNGVTALLGAVRTEQFEAVSLLLASEAKINAKDEFDLTPLMHAAAYNYPEITELLIENGANLEDRDFHGSRPLMMAAYYNCIESADILLDKGADVDGKDTFGFTPLMVAAQHGDYDMAWLLLDKGANPALKNQGGYHAMAFAVMKEDEDLVELLLESGADINQPVNVSTNSFSLAEEAKNEKMIAYLTENGGKPNRKPEISEIRAGMGLNFNADDFMVGFSAGVSENKYDMYLTTGFILRPSHVRVLRPENDTLSFQLWEKRFLWPITIGKNFTFRKKGTASAAFRIHLTGAYTWGNYRGSALKPDPQYVLIPGAGLVWRDRYFGISFDYQYLPVKVHDITRHRFTLAILGFYDIRSRIKYTRKDISWF
ncbi:MAG TPA: ankyrin repeat domain-containing protein [Bacteroides sp.]|nr:ankyrin repeat domain-containing protein [Bacteroides sp.]